MTELSLQLCGGQFLPQRPWWSRQCLFLSPAVQNQGEDDRRRSPLSGAVLEESGAETTAYDGVSGHFVPGIGARGLAPVTMLLVISATRAMTSTGETKTSNT